MTGFDTQVYESAGEGVIPEPSLVIHGSDLENAADQLASLIDEAGESGDYSKLLSGNRQFSV